MDDEEGTGCREYFLKKMMELDSTNKTTQKWIRYYLSSKEKVEDDLYAYNKEFLFFGTKKSGLEEKNAYTYFLLAEPQKKPKHEE